MKIKTEVLKRALQRVKNFTGNNSLVEIFNHIYFKTENNYLYLYASNVPASIKTKVCKVESNEEVNSIVKSERFINIINIIEDDEINLSFGEDKLTLITNNGEYYIPCFIGEFPTLNSNGAEKLFSISGAKLKENILKVKNTIGKDELRPIMTGVYFEIVEDKLNNITTSRYELSLTNCDIEAVVEKESFVLSKEITSNIFSLDNSLVEVMQDERKVYFRSENTEIAIIKLEGKTPSYYSVIPKNEDYIRINKSEFKRAINKVELFMEERIKATIKDNTLYLESNNEDKKLEGIEGIRIDKKEGRDITFGFISTYMSNVLNSIQEDYIYMYYSSPDRAILIKPNDLDKYLVMPFKV